MKSTTLLRKAVKTAALASGISRRRDPGDTVILLYHRVRTAARSEIELEPVDFEEQLATLSSTMTVRTLDRAVSDNTNGGVVVTFDDGSKDFHETVLPLLVKYQVPATLYIVTGFFDADPSLIPWGSHLSWTQVKEAASTGLITVGSHTHTHANLARADLRTAGEEITRSKDAIEDQLDVDCLHFSFPWAVANAGAEAVARDHFKTVALRAWKTNKAGKLDVHRLGRIPVLRSDGRLFFRAKASGRLDAEGWFYRLAGRGPWGNM